MKLYHRIAHEGSARVRKYLQDHDLIDQIDFANIGVGDRDRAELEAALPGVDVPVLKTDSGEWISGADEILLFLEQLKKRDF